MSKPRKLIYRGYCNPDGFMELPRERIKTEIKDRFAAKHIKMVISADTGEKSHEQLGYYYGVLLPYAMYGFIQAGSRIQIDNQDDEDDVDQLLKDKFLRNGVDLVDANGEAHKTKSSLATADHQEVCDFMDWVINWLSENLHVVVPESDKKWKDKGEGKSVKQKLLEKIYGI